MSKYIDEVFDRGGILDEFLPNYEVRPGQVELARAFDRAIEEERALVAEGPCGSGKGFSYLIPAIYKSAIEKVGKTIVVTANIALQEQLVNKDLPFLQGALPHPFTFGLLKGRGNYLCLTKRYELEKRLTFDDKGLPISGMPDGELDAFRNIWLWTTETVSGDKSDYSGKTDKIWWKLSSTSDECLGKGCPYARACFANRALVKAMGSDILVMNYHLRFIGDGAMTPEHAILICDEAHEMADIARGFLGWTLSVNQANRIAKWLKKNDGAATGSHLLELAGKFFLDVAEIMGNKLSVRLYDRDWIDAEGFIACLERAGVLANGVTEAIEGELRSDPQNKGLLADKARAEMMGTNAQLMAIHIDEVIKLEKENWVWWLAKDPHRPRYTVEARPIDVSDIISKMIFPKASSSVLLISATMTTGDSFNYVREEVGVPEDAGEIIAPSPFDLREQGLLFVPSEMSPPPKYGDKKSELEFQNDLCYYCEELIHLCGGRCLLLFSSWKNLNYVHRHLTSSLPLDGYAMLKQGDAARMKLISQFKEDETSVLLGVASFWTGVDIPGRSLTGLFIDKIPFSSPSDPVNKALEETFKRRGMSFFMKKSLPEAVIRLRQGAGRLIRTRSDIGIVCIADTRLLNSRYGDGIVMSLPDFKKVRSLDKAKSLAERLMQKYEERV